MIDWVSIVRSSGQRFSNVIVNSVPNKVRRKRRKRRLQEQHDQILQRQVFSGGPPNAINNAGLGSSSFSGGGVISGGPECICGLMYPDEIGGGTVRSSSFSAISSPTGSSPPGGGVGAIRLSTPSLSGSSPGSGSFRHNSLCEVHGKLVSF